ncbi:MAG: hypothetical protein A2669_02405 [Candidatus Yanofskybacteria bacterium RIFCSPHIGHO2_01_FULL_48_25b]|uniref:Transglycosylase SLT domain-containing protein n=1 Tax=Candidatus Yanofskybacteria bacterium RIFCSPHIGHO2_01_FULL_48_25b TaxID=1802672 RepID=A0A1F8F333_9BACT|nr:MAG: hypothetical protein A2669_02405 [Candidatus Yanofskybacteria bacterium RIFCSPHIGHO2_01_FULL_48_25b]
MFFKKILIILVVALPLFFALSRQAAAVDWFPIVPCGLNQQPAAATRQDTLPDGTKAPHDYTQPCNQCLLIELGKNMIDFTLFGIVPMVGTLFFIYAGFKILLGRDNPNAIKDGQAIITKAATGIAILLSAWLITNFILKSLATDDTANQWYKIECRVGDLKNLADATIPSVNRDPQTPTAPGTGTAGAGTPAGPGNTCPLSGVNLCAGKPRENPDNSCVASGCYDYVPWILKYSNQFGVDANLLKAVMMQESSCDPSKRSASSYGLMALQPATANIVRQKCGIQSSVDGQWLIDHPAESICLSAAYLTTIKSGICGTDVRNIAAGYNAGPGRCAVSSDCAGQQSCSNEPVRQWECLYDNPQQTVCNKGLDQTRNYAINVLYCQQNPGF